MSRRTSLRPIFALFLVLPVLALGSAEAAAQDLVSEETRAEGSVHTRFEALRFPAAGEFTHSFLTTAQIIYLPDFILDSYFTQHASHWDGRSNLAFGLDYILRRVDSWELRIGVQWANLAMPSEYWVEAGKTSDTADFTHFNLSVLSAEASFFGNWDLIDEVGIFYGGGLWLGGLLGSVSKANILRECTLDEMTQEVRPWSDELARCSTDGVFEEETALPPVIGLATVSAGARFQLAEHFVARIEGGFRGWFFGGISIGGQLW